MLYGRLGFSLQRQRLLGGGKSRLPVGRRCIGLIFMGGPVHGILSGFEPINRGLSRRCGDAVGSVNIFESTPST
jgi:hypothetical protein